MAPDRTSVSTLGTSWEAGSGRTRITMMNALRQRDIAVEKRAEARQEGLAVARERAIEELHGSRQETVECLARAIEMHDAETGQHVKRMGSIAAFLGDLLRLDRDRVLLLRAAAPMHDVGKIATPEDILQKPGPLTPGERKQMERHTTVGHQIDPRIVDALLDHLDEALRLRSVHP